VSRWAAGIEYLGAAYSGWQAQHHSPSVQRSVEQALSAVADQPVGVIAAGRTDAGVHAFQQVIHFDCDRDRNDHAWLLGANTHLPDDIGLRWVRAVPQDFDARRRATARRYRYVILNSRARPALLAGRAGWMPVPLDETRMHRAAQDLLGEHDFSSFRDAECQSKSPMRNVHSLTVRRLGDFILLDIEANAFLHHMVRNITGVLTAVGQGRQSEAWVREVLEHRDRRRGGVTVEPDGLYFVGPVYPDHFGLPKPPNPWFPGYF
jgi:tRNA pseudouridine38-40 synthase